MSVRTIPGKRWTDEKENVTYPGLALTSLPGAIIEPGTIGKDKWVDADMRAAIATAPLGVGGIWTKVGDQTVPAHGKLLFNETVENPDVAPGQVVFPDQRGSLYLRAFTSVADTGSGVLARVVHLAAYNFSGAGILFPDGFAVRYAAVGGFVSPLPAGPNAMLEVTPDILWATPNQPLTVASLNQIPAVTAAIADGSITGQEINTRDLIALAARYAGIRGTFLTGAVAIAAGAIATLGVIVMTGVTVGNVIKISQAGFPIPIFTGFVSSADHVTIQARNTLNSSYTLPAGRFLNVLAI